MLDRWRDFLLDSAEEIHRLAMDSIPDSLPPGGWAYTLLAEYLMVAKRSLTSIEVLMERTFNTERDHTEDAASLQRKLIEIQALVRYVADMGEDPDIQALRVELKEARAQQRTQEELSRAQVTRGGLPVNPDQLDLVRSFPAVIEDELRQRGAEPKNAENLTDIMKQIDPGMLYRWQYESSVSHGGLRGRGLQRQGTTIGVDARPTRQADVFVASIAGFGFLAARVVRFLGYDDSSIYEFLARFDSKVDLIRASAASEREISDPL